MRTASYRLPVFATIFIAIYVASVGSVLADKEKEETPKKDPVDEGYTGFEECLLSGDGVLTDNTIGGEPRLLCTNDSGSWNVPKSM